MRRGWLACRLPNRPSCSARRPPRLTVSPSPAEGVASRVRLSKIAALLTPRPRSSPRRLAFSARHSAQRCATCAAWSSLALAPSASATAATPTSACSGTVTTELAMAGPPVVVGYKIGGLSYAILKRLVRTRWISLVNIAAGRMVMPEFIQARERVTLWIARSREAERTLKSGAPFLQRYLPFWAATLFDRIIVLLVPLIGVAIGLLVVGYIGLFMSPLQSLVGMQIFIDLVIALSLVMVWLWRDAQTTGRNAWPWLLATLTLGSFGPLLYLLTKKPSATR